MITLKFKDNKKQNDIYALVLSSEEIKLETLLNRQIEKADCVVLNLAHEIDAEHLPNACKLIVESEKVKAIQINTSSCKMLALHTSIVHSLTQDIKSMSGQDLLDQLKYKARSVRQFTTMEVWPEALSDTEKVSRMTLDKQVEHGTTDSDLSFRSGCSQFLEVDCFDIKHIKNKGDELTHDFQDRLDRFAKCIELGKVAEAIPYLKGCVFERPDFQELFEELILLELDTGLYMQAKESLRTYLAHYPNTRQWRTVLEKLNTI